MSEWFVVGVGRNARQVHKPAESATREDPKPDCRATRKIDSDWRMFGATPPEERKCRHCWPDLKAEPEPQTTWPVGGLALFSSAVLMTILSGLAAYGVGVV